MGKILKIRDLDDAVVAAPNVTRFDLVETDKFREELADIVAVDKDKPLLIDLSAVDFVTSATIGVLADLHKRCKASGRPLALIRVQPKVQHVLEMSHLDRVFSIHADEDAALSAL
jgi:anti-sigma B factor antagonist